MQLSNNWHLYLAASLIFVIGSVESPAADKNPIDWLRGNGKDLEMRLAGEVFETDGQPAKEIEITGLINTWMGQRHLKSVIAGNHFETWIPVNESNWHSLVLSARSLQSDSVAYLTLQPSELRQAIVSGVKLMLKTPTRNVDIKVIDKGQPVSGATVNVEVVFGIELQSRTDESGTAHFRLLPDKRLSRVMAWTEDFRIGGYGFDGNPVRDAGLDEHLVELSACRDLKIRCVDQDGAPVTGIPFRLLIATPAPNYNYIGTNEHSVMTTDENGEVIYKWLPDWEQHHFYPEPRTDKWVLDVNTDEGLRIADGVTTVIVKKSRINDRKRVTGHVKSRRSRVGGFYVILRSFQGEQKQHSDLLGAFTDADGSFAVDVLPDATYCTYVLDGRWVGNIIDVTPYETETDRTNSPQLTVSDGQSVEVLVTSGPTERPYSNLSILFHRPHSFKFREDGQMRNGLGGPSWWVTADEAGRAVTHTLPGELKVSVYTPLWRTEETVEVTEGEPVTILLHREIDQKQSIAGRLVLPEGTGANLKDAVIRIGSVDGSTQDQQTLTCGEDGHFAFETLASQIGIFATTKDGQVAGSLIVNDVTAPIELPLIPTIDFAGQLVSDSEEPLAGLKIRAVASVEGKQGNARAMFLNQFEAKRVEALTDDVGNFTLKGLPANVKVQVWAVAANATEDRYLEELLLQPNESRPREIYRVAKNSNDQKKRPLAKRYRANLRDCELSGYHTLVILTEQHPLVTEFVDVHFKDYETNPDVYTFIPLVVIVDRTNPDTEDLDFLKEMNWQQPKDGQILAYALDGKGNVLGQLEIDIADEGAATAAVAFVHQHAPAKMDAEKKWNEAFAEAKRSNRRVWVRVSQRYCGPCFRLTRWLDDQRKILEKDYVMLKIDDFWDQNGGRVAERLTRETNHGVPFSAIFDAGGELLVDSVGPVGNVGFPSGFEGKKQLREMLVKSRSSLSDSEIDSLIESIDGRTRDADNR